MNRHFGAIQGMNKVDNKRFLNIFIIINYINDLLSSVLHSMFWQTIRTTWIKKSVKNTIIKMHNRLQSNSQKPNGYKERIRGPQLSKTRSDVYHLST